MSKPATYVIELDGVELMLLLKSLQQLPFSFAREGLIEKLEQQIHFPTEKQESSK